tara:strand:+ start:13437 stop:14507 length:1071 start_codon:yes stop_codon:yes gene_type:complete
MSGIVLKPANRAAQLYVGGSGVQQSVRQQHQYVLVYNMYPITFTDPDDFLSEKLSYLKEFKDRLHFLCNTVDGPKFQIQQDVLNQYNRKRVINRKVDYDPLTVRMYDTVDGLGMKFARTLYEFEFQNARLYKTKAGGADLNHQEDHNYNQSVLVPSSRFVDSHHFGIQSKKYFHRLLKSIDLYQMAGGTYSKVRMIHPRISRMDMDTFSYESSTPVNISLAFTYENLVFEETNVKLDGSDPEYAIDTMMSESADFEDFVPSTQSDDVAPSITKKKDELMAGAKDFINNLKEGGNFPPSSAKSETTTTDTQGLKPFKGTLKSGEKIRNIDGKSYVVPKGGSNAKSSTKSVSSKYIVG